MNGILGRKNKTSVQTPFSFHDRTTTNNDEISEGFNDYFCSIADTQAQNIHSTDALFSDYLPEPVPHSFDLSLTSVIEIKGVIKNLRITSPGHDDIHIKVLKEMQFCIAPFLKFIINKSFDEGSFPGLLQIAKVIPIYKKGE